MAVRKPSLSNFFTVALVAWILVIAGKFGYTQWQDYVTKNRVPSRDIAKWHDLIADRKPSLGNDKAHVVVIEFFDYQCPYCKLLEPRLEKLVADHPGEIAIYRYDFPLTGIHPYAMSAAIAADCAAMQNVTEAYQSQLFRQASFEDFSWTDLSKRIGVRDVNEFSKCMNQKTPSSLIDHDVATGKSLNIASTPTLIFNGSMVSGALSDSQLAYMYKKASKSRS